MEKNIYNVRGTIHSKVQKFDLSIKNMLTLIYDCDQKMTYDAGFFPYFQSSGNTQETEKIVLFIAVDLHLD